MLHVNHFKAQPADLTEGDHICVRRCGVLYAHHGVYVGNDRVVHYTDARGMKGKAGSQVVETSLKDFLGDGELRRVTYASRDDGLYSADRARRWIDSGKYSLIFNNCEHFASYCATGRKKSVQVRRFAAGAAAALLVGANLLFRRSSA